MNNRFLRIIRHAILALDLITLNLIVISLQFGSGHISEDYSIEYARFWMWLNACWILISWICNLYHERYVVSFERFSHRTMYIYFYWVMLIMIYLYFTHGYIVPRLYISIIVFGYGLALLFNRFVYAGVRFYSKKKHLLRRQVIILGFNEQAKKLATYLEAEGMNTEIIGFCEEEGNIQELSHYPILSSIDKAMEIAQQYKVSDIYSTIAPEQDLGIYQLMDKADQACIHFRLIPDLSFFIKESVHIHYMRDMPVITVRDEPLMDAGNRIRKRIFDILFSASVIVFVLSWLLPIISLLIKLDSRGPVFFLQNRLGRNNRVFKVFKFRTMKRAESDKEFKQATKNDARVTRIGNFLRKTSLDEFPQFINVFLGQMSICGPRPHPLKLNDMYKNIIEKYMVRQFLKPGITGWAQVNGFRGETKTIEQMKGRIEYDIWYLENWGLWLDVKIIILTFYNVIRGEKQAY